MNKETCSLEYQNFELGWERDSYQGCGSHNSVVYDELIHASSEYKAVYFLDGNLLNADLENAPSFSWHSIISARHILQAGLVWKIGSGTQVRIWEDNWILNVYSSSLQRPVGSCLTFVSKLINLSSMSWNVSLLHSLFSPELVESIRCIPLSSRRPGDPVTLKLEKRGFFSVKSCYRIVIFSISWGPFCFLWRSLWRAKVPGKGQVCVWRACKNFLPTRAKLVSKGYVGDMGCLLCSHPYECIGHIMCECPKRNLLLEVLLSHFRLMSLTLSISKNGCLSKL